MWWFNIKGVKNKSLLNLFYFLWSEFISNGYTLETLKCLVTYVNDPEVNQISSATKSCLNCFCSMVVSTNFPNTILPGTYQDLLNSNCANLTSTLSGTLQAFLTFLSTDWLWEAIKKRIFKDILNPIPVALLLKQRKPGNDHKHSSRGCQFDTHPTGVFKNFNKEGKEFLFRSLLILFVSISVPFMRIDLNFWWYSLWL